jgi:predicted dehydrogenase
MTIEKPCRRVVLVGVGAWGFNWIRAVESSPRWDVAAIVDLDEAALDRAIHELDLDEALCYKDFNEALQDTTPQAAILSIPCPQRDPVFEAACREKLHCLIEKPSAYTLDQINRYLALAREAGNTVMVAHNYRFAAISRRIRDLVRDHEYGELNYLHATIDRRLDLEGRFFEATPHAAFLEGSIQAFDLLRMFVNEDPVSVMARSGNPPASAFRNEPCAAAIVEFASGRMATLWTSWTAAENTTTWYGTWDLFFDAAVVRTDGRALRLIRGGKAEDLIAPKPMVPLHLEAVLDHFADALDRGVVPECDLEENVGTIALLLAAVESAKTRKAVDVQDFLQHRIR